MGTIRVAFLLTILAFAQPQLAVPQTYVCPITKAPAERFIPPLPWNQTPMSTENYFYLGTPGLWTVVKNPLTLRRDKLAYWSERYDWKTTIDPPLAVVARRLDAPAPLVWAHWVGGGGPTFTASEGFDPSRRDGGMGTIIEIPSKGCWEISAHFTDVRDKVETLTYVVRVD